MEGINLFQLHATLDRRKADQTNIQLVTRDRNGPIALKNAAKPSCMARFPQNCCSKPIRHSGTLDAPDFNWPFTPVLPRLHTEKQWQSERFFFMCNHNDPSENSSMSFEHHIHAPESHVSTAQRFRVVILNVAPALPASILSNCLANIHCDECTVTNYHSISTQDV